MSIFLKNPEYFEVLNERISKAKKSIKMTMYLADMWGSKKYKTHQLAQSLAKAIKRGVYVDIILEGSSIHVNYEFYNYLKKRGADIWLDTSANFIHEKAICIDNKYLIAGSHNLTRVSLGLNCEISLITKDKRSIKKFNDHFKVLSRQRINTLKNRCKDGMKLPLSILINQLCTFQTRHSQGLFDLYLLLYKLSRGGKRVLDVDYNGWGAAIGLSNKDAKKDASSNYKKYYVLNLAYKMLLRIDKKYGFIKFDTKKGRVKIKAVAKHPTKFFLPETYWKYKWFDRLSTAAKYLYFVTLIEVQNSPFHPWCQLNWKDISKRYKISHDALSNAKKELRRYNLLEMIPSIPQKGERGYNTESYYFRPNPFYNPADFDKDLARIKKKYSGQVASTALKVVKALGDDHDLEKIIELCELAKKCSTSKLASIGRKLARIKSPTSKKTMAYIRYELGEVITS
ncbi:hypothetical protein KKA47_02165 [bacterium]|nr:hypothetical protein [bacterium]